MSSLDATVEAAHAAWLEYRTWSPERIVELLEAIAKGLEAAKDQLVPVAMEESHLPLARLDGEVGRTTGQLRLMASAVLDPTYFDIVIDHEIPTSTPPRPDLRTELRPLGVVAVFGASNFPFAFGFAGNDTAAALAAGCAVVVKVNPGHPKLSEMIFEIMTAAAASVGAPKGLIGIVRGFDEGLALVQHPLVKAVAFTGSTRGGRALADAIHARKEPIPFYGELGGLNPIFVTRAAVAARSRSIAEGFIGSVTLGSGQFCTKPGFLIAENADEICAGLAELVPSLAGQQMLNKNIAASHDAIRDEVESVPGISLVARNNATDGTSVSIFHISAADFLAKVDLVQREVFGPTAVVIDCANENEMIAVARSFSGTLASGIHGEANDQTLPTELIPTLEDISGRIIWNSWPTGVAVTWAMHHGGPYPASTNALFTSVGGRAPLRFRRPITYQNFPQELLGDELRDAGPHLDSARIDGKFQRK